LSKALQAVKIELSTEGSAAQKSTKNGVPFFPFYMSFLALLAPCLSSETSPPPISFFLPLLALFSFRSFFVFILFLFSLFAFFLLHYPLFVFLVALFTIFFAQTVKMIRLKLGCQFFLFLK
jgi:hypothetical protein